MNKLIRRWTIAAAPLLCSIVFLCFSVRPASAQESSPAPASEVEQNAGNQNGDLIKTLGLTPEQLGKIRTIREQNKEERRLATERLRGAQQALDAAIYSDEMSELVIEERTRELVAAQTATMRLRVMTELSIRRVLTPEQLATLRGLRLRQAERRRIERGMMQPRRLRDRQPGSVDGQTPLQRERFRQRQNNQAQPTDEAKPAAVRRGELFRRNRP
ncbi:MAG: periplasmic protein CpxP/Spy [Blastocatellia bacterium]|jgi:Spy/CpxP family protein refolding chaperone|nr:periplasmic protein CpxP/Spy [Blastocatellia bacterium]